MASYTVSADRILDYVVDVAFAKQRCHKIKFRTDLYDVELRASPIVMYNFASK